MRGIMNTGPFPRRAGHQRATALNVYFDQPVTGLTLKTGLKTRGSFLKCPGSVTVLCESIVFQIIDQPFFQFNVCAIEYGENLEWSCLAFQNNPVDQLEGVGFSNKIGCGFADEQIASVVFSQTLQPSGHIHRIPDDGRFHFTRRTHVAEYDFAEVKSAAHRERPEAALLPIRIETGKRSFHSSSRFHCQHGISRRPGAIDVSPNGEDGIADEFVDRATTRENVFYHQREVL